MFEIRTLLLFSFSLKAFLGILLFVYGLKHVTFKPTLYVAIGSIISALGFLVHSFYPKPAEVVNLLMLNLLVNLGDSLFLVGLWVLQSKKINRAFIFIVILISLVQTFFFTNIWRHDGVRVAINSMVYASIGFYVLWEFSSLLKKRIPSLYYTIGFILITHCLILLLRAAFVVSNPRIDIFASTPISTFMHLYIVLGQTSAVFCYAIIVNQMLREQLAEALEVQKRLQTFKDDLSSMIVHDLKNPLNALINANVAFEGRELGDFVKQTGTQMLQLVSNILDINKYEESSIPINQTNVKLSKLLDLSMEGVKHLYEQKNLTIIKNISPDVSVYVDSGLVIRVFQNLLTNAIKFSPTNETIFVTSKPGDRYVKIFITDKGEGIAPEFHSIIFSKYGQVQSKNAGITSATGLGLTFCKLAVEAHGCEIGIISEVKKGSTFWFTLPLSENVSQSSEGVIADASVSANNDELNLTESERMMLIPYAKALSEVKIYELSEIKNILAPLEKNSSENILKWLNKVLKSVYTGNEQGLKSIIEVVLRDKQS